MPQRLIVMLGAPGSGKGTQAATLAAALQLAHLSTGDMLRRERQQRTAHGLQAQAAMDRGDLVPDELITDMVHVWLGTPAAAGGAVLDGFPRTTGQALALEETAPQRGGPPTRAILLDVSAPEVVQRLAARLVCVACGASYHLVASPPLRVGQCDHCGAILSQRSDDRADVIATRIEVYEQQTRPLVAYYAERGLLTRVDGSQGIDQVRADVLRAASRNGA